MVASYTGTMLQHVRRYYKGHAGSGPLSNRAERRDAAVVRLRTVTGALALGAAGLAGAFYVAVSHALPGRAAASPRTTVAPLRSGGSVPPLRAPAHPPASAGPVVTTTRPGAQASLPASTATTTSAAPAGGPAGTTVPATTAPLPASTVPPSAVPPATVPPATVPATTVPVTTVPLVISGGS